MNYLALVVGIIYSILLVGAIIGIFALIIKSQQIDYFKNSKKKNKKKTKKNFNANISFNVNDIIPINSKPILTNEEYNFYVQIMHIAERHNLMLWGKVRIIDIISLNKSLLNKHYNKFYNISKIETVDFILMNKDTLQVLAAIDFKRKYQSEEEVKIANLKNSILQTANITFFNFDRSMDFNKVIEQILSSNKLKK